MKGKTSLLSRKQTLGGVMTAGLNAQAQHPRSTRTQSVQRKPLPRQGMGGAREARMRSITLAWL